MAFLDFRQLKEIPIISVTVDGPRDKAGYYGVILKNKMNL